MSDEEKLKKLSREMWKALVAKDLKFLEKIHSEDFILTHMTGLKQSKQEYLRCIGEGILNYFSADEEKIFIEKVGKKIKLTTQFKVLAAVFGGGKNFWNLQLVFDVEKRGENFILISGIASTY